MRIPGPDHAGGSNRLASAFSAVCGALGFGLTVATCYGLAHAAHSLPALAVPGLLVRVAGAVLGIPAALIAEAVAFRLVAGRRRLPLAKASAVPADKLLVQPPRLKSMPSNHLAHL